MNNSVFGKIMENVRKHRDIKLATTNQRRNYLASEQDYHTTKFFPENLLAIKVRKTKIFINLTIYLVLSILEMSKTAIYDFWYDYA